MQSFIQHCAGLIGTPYEAGGRGPKGYDCWGLVMELYQLWHGVALPEFGTISSQARVAFTMHRNLPLFTRVEPAPGTVLLLRVKGNVAAHVGFQIDPFKFIHTWKDSGGVTVEPISLWQGYGKVVGHYTYLPSSCPELILSTDLYSERT